MSKVTNFDPLPLVSLHIGYSFIYDMVFDYGGKNLKFLIARIIDKSGVIGYTRFIQLIFNYLCPNTVFDSDELVPVFKNLTRK